MSEQTPEQLPLAPARVEPQSAPAPASYFATGDAFEWTCAEPHAKLLDVTAYRTDGPPAIELALHCGYRDVEAPFVLGPDGLVRLDDVREERNGRWFIP